MSAIVGIAAPSAALADDHRAPRSAIYETLRSPLPKGDSLALRVERSEVHRYVALNDSARDEPIQFNLATQSHRD